jgi:hypothetical protein
MFLGYSRGAGECGVEAFRGNRDMGAVVWEPCYGNRCQATPHTSLVNKYSRKQL